MRPIRSSPKSPLSAYFGAQLVHRIQVRLVSPGAQQIADGFGWRVDACERHGLQLRYGAAVVPGGSGEGQVQTLGCLDLRPAAPISSFVVDAARSARDY